MYRPKKVGGLGIWKIKEFNMALLAKYYGISFLVTMNGLIFFQVNILGEWIVLGTSLLLALLLLLGWSSRNLW